MRIWTQTKGTNPPKWTKNRHTITVFVRQIQREQEKPDSDRIVPLF